MTESKAFDLLQSEVNDLIAGNVSATASVPHAQYFNPLPHDRLENKLSSTLKTLFPCKIDQPKQRPFSFPGHQIKQRKGFGSLSTI